MSAALDLYHLNLHRPSARQEAADMLAAAGAPSELFEWCWEQLERLDAKHQDKVLGLKGQIEELEQKLEEAIEVIKALHEEAKEVQP